MSRADKSAGKRIPVFAAKPLLAVLFLTLWAGGVLSAPDVTTALSQIAAALSSGNGAQALALSDATLRQAGLSAADHSRLVLDRGLANQMQGSSAAALADLTEAINARGLTVPEQARAFLERGLVLDGLNRLNDAIGDYGAVLRLTPNSPTALNNRANAFRRQNRFDEAQRDYLASLAADNPAPEYPYFGLGQIAEREGKDEEAKNFYVRALTANPGYGLAAQRLTALGGNPRPAGCHHLAAAQRDGSPGGRHRGAASAGSERPALQNGRATVHDKAGQLFRTRCPAESTSGFGRPRRTAGAIGRLATGG